MFHNSKKSSYSSTAQSLCRMQMIITIADRLLLDVFFFPLGSWFDAEVLMLGPSLSYLACVLQPLLCLDTQPAHLEPGLLTCHPGYAWPCPCPHSPAWPSRALSDPGCLPWALSCPICNMTPQPGLCHLNCSMQIGWLNNGKGHKIHDSFLFKNAEENIWGYSSVEICLKTSLWGL